jgi:hypothetical protein
LSQIFLSIAYLDMIYYCPVLPAVGAAHVYQAISLFGGRS